MRRPPSSSEGPSNSADSYRKKFTSLRYAQSEKMKNSPPPTGLLNRVVRLKVHSGDCGRRLPSMLTVAGTKGGIAGDVIGSVNVQPLPQTWTPRLGSSISVSL